MQRIKEVREAASISASDLAMKLGMTSSAIGHYEKERRTPDITMCWRVVHALNELGASCEFYDVFPDPQSNHTDSVQ